MSKSLSYQGNTYVLEGLAQYIRQEAAEGLGEIGDSRIADLIELAGWEMRPVGSEGKVVSEIPEDLVEVLAMIEHEAWVKERTDFGWIYGVAKSTEKKISPYLVPYDDLPE